MYVDTAHNSPSTAYANVYRGLLVVALKFQAYVQEWGVDARRKSSFLYSQSRFKINALEPGADRALALKKRQTTCSRLLHSSGRRLSTRRGLSKRARSGLR